MLRIPRRAVIAWPQNMHVNALHILCQGSPCEPPKIFQRLASLAPDGGRTGPVQDPVRTQASAGELARCRYEARLTADGNGTHIFDLKFRYTLSALDNCPSSIYIAATFNGRRGSVNLVVGEWFYVKSSSLSVRVRVFFSENKIRCDVCH